MSPASTGGAGTLFEYRVGAMVLAHLLTGTHPPGLSLPSVQVAFQQRVSGHLLDDILVYGERDTDGLCLEYQVKQKLKVTPGDREFVEVITQVLHTLQEKPDDIAEGRLRLGLIAGDDAAHLDQLKKLTEFAAAHDSYESLETVIAPGIVGQQLRKRLSYVQAAVQGAIQAGAPDLGDDRRATHAALAALHVWRVDERDDLLALDMLAPLAEAFGKTSIDLLGHLNVVAENLGPHAGRVTAGAVRRRLRWRGLREATDTGQGAEEPIEADAVVRGPLVALGLDAAFDDASRLLDEGDPGAPASFRQIADTLRAKGFWSHAAIVRRREADALQACGSFDEAAGVGIALAWDYLEAALPWEAGFALRNASAASSAAAGALAAGQAAVLVAKGGSLNPLLEAFDGLDTDAPARDRAAALLCETAVALAEPQVVQAREQVLEDIARGKSRAALRVQLCLGDVTGEWRWRLNDIGRRFDPPSRAWAHARYARFLALHGDGAGAREQYLIAIERACAEEMLDDAADWLYALRLVGYWYPDDDRNDEHPIAQALRPNARPSSLPGSAHAAEKALRAMQDGNKPLEAMQRARAWLWQGVTRASLTAELAAARSIGMHLHREGHPAEAITWFIRAGEVKRAETAAKDVTTMPAGLDAADVHVVDDCRAAAYAAVAAAADLLDDDIAAAWALRALTDFLQRADDGPRDAVSARCLDVLAALGTMLPAPEATELLHAIRPLVGEGPSHTDRSVANIFVCLARHREDALILALHALLASPRMRSTILGAADLLVNNQDLVAEHLTAAAACDERAAAALILSEADPTPALPVAERLVRQALRSTGHVPAGISIPTEYTSIGILARPLSLDLRVRFATRMVACASNRGQPANNIRDALSGLCNIAGDLDEGSKRALFPPTMQLLQAMQDAPTVDPSDEATRPREPETMADLALLAAARLATTSADTRAIERSGMALVRGATRQGQLQVCRALNLLPAGQSGLDLEGLAVHPVPGLRAVAAVRWARSPESLSTERAVALARDESYVVRYNLALAISDNYSIIPAHHRRSIVNVLKQDNFRSIRILLT